MAALADLLRKNPWQFNWAVASPEQKAALAKIGATPQTKPAPKGLYQSPTAVTPTPKAGGFTPFTTPTKPPTGTYDPVLDAQERATQRGLTDLRADTGLAGTRAAEDYRLGQGNIGRERDEGLADLLRARGRQTTDFGTQETDIRRTGDESLADLLRARSRGEEDYGVNSTGLARQYTNLGSQQTQQGRAAGLHRGGFAAQSARKRGANQALEQGALDRSIGRSREDSALGESRLQGSLSRALSELGLSRSRYGEDSSLSEGRLKSAADRSLGALGVDYARGTTDRSTALSRGEREAGFFGQDTSESRFYQAKGTGYEPPTKPKHEVSLTVGGKSKTVQVSVSKGKPLITTTGGDKARPNLKDPKVRGTVRKALGFPPLRKASEKQIAEMRKLGLLPPKKKGK